MRSPGRWNQLDTESLHFCNTLDKLGSNGIERKTTGFPRSQPVALGKDQRNLGLNGNLVGTFRNIVIERRIVGEAFKIACGARLHGIR